MSIYPQRYNPRAYVPGGASTRVAKATQAKGIATAKKPPRAPQAPLGPVQINTPYLPKIVMPDDTFAFPEINGQTPGSPNNAGPAAPPALPPKDPKYDYSSDPILRMFEEQMKTSTDKRKSLDLERQKRILLGFGSRSLAEEVLGPNDPFAAAISDDPLTSTSALAQLGYAFNQSKRDTVEEFNDVNFNLFYSGHHGKAQRELARQRMLQEAGLASQAKDQLGSIAEAFQAFLDEQRMGKIGAEQEAYMRAIQAALNAGGDTAAETGGGTDPSSESNPNPPPTQPPQQPPPVVAEQPQNPVAPKPNPPASASPSGSVPAATPAANAAAQTAKETTPGPPDLQALAARSAALNELYKKHISDPLPVSGGLTSPQKPILQPDSVAYPSNVAQPPQVYAPAPVPDARQLMTAPPPAPAYQPPPAAPAPGPDLISQMAREAEQRRQRMLLEGLLF